MRQRTTAGEAAFAPLQPPDQGSPGLWDGPTTMCRWRKPWRLRSIVGAVDVPQYGLRGRFRHISRRCRTQCCGRHRYRDRRGYQLPQRASSQCFSGYPGVSARTVCHRSGIVGEAFRVPPGWRNGGRLLPGSCPKRFWPILNGGEISVLLCFVFLYLFATGAGPFSVDAALRGRQPGVRDRVPGAR